MKLKELFAAREAGASIKPRVERGFASATLGTDVKKGIEPVKRATAATTPLSPISPARFFL